MEPRSGALLLRDVLVTLRAGPRQALARGAVAGGAAAVTGQRALDRANGDLVSVQFTFVGGAVGTINVVSATPFYARLAVFGNKGWVDIHETAHAATPGESHMYIGTPGGKRERRIYKPTNIVRRNLEAWADAVAGKSEYRFTDEQKVANVAFMEALVRSAASGKPERVRN